MYRCIPTNKDSSNVDAVIKQRKPRHAVCTQQFFKAIYIANILKHYLEYKKLQNVKLNDTHKKISCNHHQKSTMVELRENTT